MSVMCWWLFKVPTTCWCISETALLWRLNILPHWDWSCRSDLLSLPVTVYSHQASQSQQWPFNTRCPAGWPLEYQFLSHRYDSTSKKKTTHRKWSLNPCLPYFLSTDPVALDIMRVSTGKPVFKSQVYLQKCTSETTLVEHATTLRLKLQVRLAILLSQCTHTRPISPSNDPLTQDT